MGALLAGATSGLRCPEEANLRAPESVVAVHASYIRAGAELIETNTFGANRRKLAAKLLDQELEAINSAAVRLAREAREVSGRDVWIAGAIGPLGELEVFDANEHGPLYAEQAGVLEGRGVDLFMIETFFDLDELVSAVEAVRAVSSLPIVALLTFDDEAEVAGGVEASAAAARLAELDVAAIGTNHGAGPHAALTALDAMRGHGLPLAALPNIGLASIVGGRVVYPHSTPEYFGDFASQAVALGARIVGGCCGTTPAQIEAIRFALDENREPRVAFEARERHEPQAPTAASEETQLARALRAGDWVVSVELDPPKGGTNEAMIEVARTLRDSGVVGFVDVNDNPMARARMNALMASIAIQRATGLETIPHVTPRDTTVMGLEGVLLGAHADGVRNILAVTGDPPHVGDYPGSRGVYEIDSIGLVQLLAAAERRRRLRRQGDRPADVVLHRRRGQSVRRRSRARARAVRAEARRGGTLRHDPGALRPRRAGAFPASLGGTSPIPLLAGVWPLRSYAMALRLHNEVPGIRSPQRVLEALHDAGAAAPAVGLALARELLAALREHVAGVYVIPPFKQPEAALDLLLEPA